jgi:hypothetical protein
MARVGSHRRFGSWTLKTGAEVDRVVLTVTWQWSRQLVASCNLRTNIAQWNLQLTWALLSARQGMGMMVLGEKWNNDSDE